MKISWWKQPGSMSRRAALQGDGITDPQATLGKQRYKSSDAEFHLHNRCATAQRLIDRYTYLTYS